MHAKNLSLIEDIEVICNMNLIVFTVHCYGGENHSRNLSQIIINGHPWVMELWFQLLYQFKEVRFKMVNNGNVSGKLGPFDFLVYERGILPLLKI